MNNIIVRNIIRFLFLLIIQIILFNGIELNVPEFTYLKVFVYPLAILLLPVATPSIILIGSAFILGTIVDAFYNSPGVHAGALVFMAFCRPYILKYLEPQGGYGVNALTTKEQNGAVWFFIFSAILISLHIVCYFILEIFSFKAALDIFLSSFFSFILSWILILIYIFLINPKT